MRRAAVGVRSTDARSIPPPAPAPVPGLRTPSFPVLRPPPHSFLSEMTTVAEIFQTMEYGPAPESDKEALAWLGRHERVFGHYIDGAWTEPGSMFEVINPSTAQDDRAGHERNRGRSRRRGAGGARRRSPSGRRSPRTRGRATCTRSRAACRSIRDCSPCSRRMDNGKSIRETRDIDIPLVARHFYHHAGWAQLLDTEFAGYEAVGVVGQIIPWNFPLLMLAWKIAPALAAGNTVILKPAEFTPMTALAFAEIVEQAGAAAGRSQHHHGRRVDRRRDRRAPRRRQDRIHRIDRGRSDHPPRDGRLGQEAEPRARRKESVHRL